MVIGSSPIAPIVTLRTVREVPNLLGGFALINPSVVCLTVFFVTYKT